MAGERFIKGKIVKGDLIGTSIVIGPFPGRQDPCDTVMVTDLCNPAMIELEGGRWAILATCDTAAITSGCDIGPRPGPQPSRLAGLAARRLAGKAAAKRGPTKGTKRGAARKRAKTK